MSANAAAKKEQPKYSKGLAGVIAGESDISTVGKEGTTAGGWGRGNGDARSLGRRRSFERQKEE